MNSIFENYEMFINEHASDITSPSDALRLITDTSMFRSYVDALVESAPADVRPMLIKVCERQRSTILHENANTPASAFGFGWTVLSYPILVDIYAEPLISKVMNVYPTESPILSIPHVRINATTRGYDGVTRTQKLVPNNRNLIRADSVDVNVAHATSANIKTLAFAGAADPVKAQQFKMNRRFLSMKNVTIAYTTTSSGDHTVTVPLQFRTDNRAQIIRKFNLPLVDGTKYPMMVQAHINYDEGVVFFNILPENESFVSILDSYTVGNAVFNARFTPVESMWGRTAVEVFTESHDLTVDINDDFMISLTQEQIQDYRSIFKIDLARTLTEAIKRQILLNVDHDLAYFLGAAEDDIKNKHEAYASIDFNNFSQTSAATNYRPNSMMDVFRNIAPKIAYVNGIIRRNFNMYPKYILTGLNTATMLKSLQDLAVSMPGLQGELGMVGSAGQFNKMEVLESAVLPDDKIYLTTKAEEGSLEKSTLIHVVYNPLYTISETTDGNQRTFVRSRTAIEIPRTDGLGMIECFNLEDMLKE